MTRSANERKENRNPKTRHPFVNERTRLRRANARIFGVSTLSHPPEVWVKESSVHLKKRGKAIITKEASQGSLTVPTSL